MTRQNINIGSTANDGTGDPLRTAFDKINDNFVELYGSDNDINTLDANLNVNNFSITTGVTNGNITITPNGTGNINLGALKFNGTSISSDDSTIVNINEALRVEGALTATGALTSNTSLTLASGATVTGIDNGALGSSASLLATQGAIKTYIDAQNTSQALTFVGDDSTGTAVNSGETFQIAGGTGLTSAVSGDTLTLNIDSTVATLTGTQILTNKTLTAPVMTGNVAIDNIIINDSEISTSSNAVLTLNPGGTGTIALSANTDVTGTLSSSALLTVSAGGADITGTLITDDVTTTGNVTISGSLGLGSLNIGDLNITPEGKITTDTNGDVDVVPSGTGAINLTGPTNVTGVATVTGQLNTDNLRLDGNTISATTGGITLQAAAGQNIQAGSLFIASEINVTTGEFTTLRTDALQNDTSDGDLTISTQGTGKVIIDAGLIYSTETVLGDGAGTDAISLETAVSFLNTTGGTSSLTLATGTAGQIKHIIMTVAGNAATLTTSNGNLDATVSTSIVFDAVGENATLIYNGSKWSVMSVRGATIS
jgi:hypothetical protein